MSSHERQPLTRHCCISTVIQGDCDSAEAASALLAGLFYGNLRHARRATPSPVKMVAAKGFMTRGIEEVMIGSQTSIATRGDQIELKSVPSAAINLYLRSLDALLRKSQSRVIYSHFTAYTTPCLTHSPFLKFVEMHTAFTNGGFRASPRDVWEKRISELIDQAQQHQSPYTETFGPHTIMIHPSVYSPKYFPETWWYAQHLPPIINKGSFLEVGVGSGLTSLSVAAAGSQVFGVDINPEAVNVTQSNFEINHQKGTFVVSNIYQNVKGKFDFIYWNHPWQHDSNIPLQLKSEKTLDSEYQLLRRFVGEADGYLTDNGVILLGTSAYANHVAIVQIARQNGYSCQELVRGNESIGKGVFEEYYILELKRQ